MIEATSATSTPGVSDRSSNIGENYSRLEHVPEIDLSLLADEDLSGGWWKRNDSPNELIWTDGDRSRVREISCEDHVERLESILQNLRVQFVEEQKSDATGLTPEVLFAAVEFVPPLLAHTKSRHRPQLSVSSVFPSNGSVVELESPPTPGSATDRSSIVSSLKHRSIPKREFTMSPYDSYQPFLPRDKTVVAVPTTPRTDKKRRFWNRRSSERWVVHPFVRGQGTKERQLMRFRNTVNASPA